MSRFGRAFPVPHRVAHIPAAVVVWQGAAAGTVSTSGSAAVVLLMPVAAAGAESTTGTAAAVQTDVVGATGSVATSGSADVVQTAQIGASGTESTSGTAAAAQTMVVAAVGSVVPAGTAAAVWQATVTAAGTVSTTGTTAAVQTAAASAAGAVTTAGTAAGAELMPATAAGAVTPTGTAAVVQTVQLAAAGTVVPTGTASGAMLMPISATGTVATTGGTAAAQTAEIGAAGSVVTFGSAAPGLVIAIADAGTEATSGTAAIVLTAQGASGGAVTTTGAASAATLMPLAAAGASATSGTAGFAQTLQVAATGQASSSGGAGVVQTLQIAAAGSSSTSGVAADVLRLAGLATGTVVSSGTAATVVMLGLAASGQTSTSGSAAPLWTARVAAAGICASSGTGAVGAVMPVVAAGTSSTSGAAAAVLIVAGADIAASGTTSTAGAAATIMLLQLAAAGTVSTMGTAAGAILMTVAGTHPVIDTAAAALEARAWWPSAPPHDTTVSLLGGCLINYQGTPLWDGLDADRVNSTNLTGNGYSHGQMTGTAPPVLTGLGGPVGTITQAVTSGQSFDGAHGITTSVNIGAQKNQWVELNDGTGHTWRFQSRFTTAGSSVTPVSGSVAPRAFGIGSTIKLVWEVAVLDTFRGGNDASAPGLGSTPSANVADSNPPNILVSYTPSCPGFPNGGDWTSPPTYRVLVRAYGSTSTYQLGGSPQSASVPVAYSITTATGQLYADNSYNTGYNSAPHDQFVDLRILCIWLTLAVRYGQTQYLADAATMKPVVGVEFDNYGGGLRAWGAFTLLDLAALDPTWTSASGKTWEAIALQYLRDLYQKNYVNPAVGAYIDVQAAQDPGPALYGTTSTLNATLIAGTSYTSLPLQSPIGTALAAGKAVLVNHGGTNQAYVLSAPCLTTDTTLSIASTQVTGNSGLATFSPGDTVQPCNAPLGQARCDYAAQAAALLYVGAARAWSPGLGVIATEQANWRTAAASTAANLLNLRHATTHLFYQQTYIDRDHVSGAPLFKPVTTSVKTGDLGDTVLHLLLGYMASGDGTLLTLAKDVITALYSGGYGAYDPVHGGFWSSLATDGSSVSTSYKEVGRLGFWLGVFRLLTRVIEPGATWADHFAEWQSFVLGMSYRQDAMGWPFRTNGDYSVFIANNSGPPPFSVTESWVTLEAAGISLLNLLAMGYAAVGFSQTAGQAAATLTLGAQAQGQATTSGASAALIAMQGAAAGKAATSGTAGMHTLLGAAARGQAATSGAATLVLIADLGGLTPGVGTAVVATVSGRARAVAGSGGARVSVIDL
jgi:hypothetical protein